MQSCAPLVSSKTVRSTANGKSLGDFPTPEARKLKIAAEPAGDYFIGRRYFVQKTRFWGFLRRPRTSWSSSKLVIINEDRQRNPDRLPEFRDNANGHRYGYDQNYEYRINGYYSGKTIYEPNSNQVLPEFVITGYQLLDSDPGWLFSPDDVYDPKFITYKYKDQY